MVYNLVVKDRLLGTKMFPDVEYDDVRSNGLYITDDEIRLINMTEGDFPTIPQKTMVYFSRLSQDSRHHIYMKNDLTDHRTTTDQQETVELDPVEFHRYFRVNN